MSERYTWCFACGEDNPKGLHLQFEWVGETRYQTVFVAGPEHQSYNGLVHGGIISTLLDEVMGGYVYQKTGRPAFTARLEVRYRQPTPIGVPVTVGAALEKQRGRLYEMKSEVKLPDGTITAEAQARVLLAEGE